MKNKKKRNSKAKKNLLTNPSFWSGIIFILAAVFRLTNLSLIEFKADEALAIFSAAKFWQQPFIASNSGVSSIGVLYPPLSYFLITFLSFLSRDPIFISLIIALINCILIVLFYLVVRKYYGNVVAILSSVWLALSPWAIIYSRKIWNPDLIWLLLLPFFYFLHQLLIDKNKKATLWLFLLLALLMQLQFSGVYLFIVTLVILFIYKIKLDYVKAMGGFLLGLIPALPWIYFNLNSQPFCRDCVALWQYTKLAKAFEPVHLLRPFQFATGLYFDNLLGQDYQSFLNSFPMVSILNIVFWLGLIFLGLGIYYVFNQQKQWRFLIIYVLLIPLFYLGLRVPAYIYYVVILSPMIFLLLALGFRWLLDLNKRLTWRLLILGIFVIFQIVNVIFNLSFYQFIKTKQVINGDYGPVFAKTKEYVEGQIEPYTNLPFYGELKAYSYVYNKPQHLNMKLGEYLAKKGVPDLAVLEFEKALQVNNKDIFSRANLTHIYILSAQLEPAEKHLEILKTQDSTIAGQLQTLLDQVKTRTP